MTGFSKMLKTLIQAGFVVYIVVNESYLDMNPDLCTLMKPNYFTKHIQPQMGL